MRENEQSRAEQSEDSAAGGGRVSYSPKHSFEMFASVAVGSTCVSLEYRDFMLCSKSLSSSSALRTSLLVGCGVRMHTHARTQAENHSDHREHANTVST